MKKNVSFSLFGYDMKYYVGAYQNCYLFEEMLPDWEVNIFYHKDNSIKEEIKKLKKLKCNLIDVSTIDINLTKKLTEFPIPYFWRFFSFFNDDINISRDLDSRLSEREVEYIKRWVDGRKTYFIIRDHPCQSQYPAGLFGMKGNKHNFKTFCENYLNNNILDWGDDQIILEQYMENVQQSDIEYCGYDKKETYIPRNNKSIFIGIQLDSNNKPTESAIIALNELTNLNL